jgi:hypothetical protein
MAQKFLNGLHVSGATQLDGDLDVNSSALTITDVSTPMVKLVDTTNNLQARFRVANTYAYLSVDNPDNVAGSRLVFQIDGDEALRLDNSLNATFAGTVTANGTTLTGDQVLPTDFVSAASGGTFSGALVIDTAGGAEKMTFNNEHDTAPIADSFIGNTSKSYISFGVVAGSNDPGFIMHESSSVSAYANQGVIHLCPSDDNSTNDYVSIHGTNDADVTKLHTSGLIETVNLQMQLKSGLNAVYVNDDLQVENGGSFGGNLSVNGSNITINGAYPRFNMYSTDVGEDDYSIINNNGIFGIYNTTQATYFLSLAATTGNATFNGTIGATNFSGTSSGSNTGDQTNISGNSATTTLAANSSKLGGYTLAQIDHAEAFHTFDNIDAASTQARRYHIGRLYGCPAHWDGNWQNIEFNVTAEATNQVTLDIS